jgi:hypothetical protein
MTSNVVRTVGTKIAKAAGREVTPISDQERLDVELIAKGQLAHRIEEVQHQGMFLPEKLCVSTEAERRPALRFIWENCKAASAKVALETICHVMEGARSAYEREQNGLAFLDAINRCDDTVWALRKTNHILYSFDGYERYAVVALTTLAPKISNPFERETHLRGAALNGPRNDDPAWDIADAWERTILEIYQQDPVRANELAAKAFSEQRATA